MIEMTQGAIQHADAKAATLLGAQCALAALLAGPFELRDGIAAPGFTTLACAVCVLVGFALGASGTAWHVAAAIWPRLDGPEYPCSLGLQTVAALGRASRAASGAPRPSSTVRQRAEAWALAGALARIALAKHRRIQRSLPWTGLSAACCLGWLVLAAVSTVIGA